MSNIYAVFGSRREAQVAVAVLIRSAGCDPDAIARLPVFADLLLLYLTGKMRPDRFVDHCKLLLSINPQIALPVGPARVYGKPST